MMLSSGGLLSAPSTKLNPVMTFGSPVARIVVDWTSKVATAWLVPAAMVCPLNGGPASMTTPRVNPPARISGTKSSASVALVAAVRSTDVTLTRPLS
jgi:hypothetical protein